MITVLIADDHGILRAGLRSLLSNEPDLEIIGEAADGNEALHLTQQLCPDVLIADISMPGPSGIELARALHASAPHTRVLILSMHEDLDLVQAAFQAGAKGYLPKRTVESDLISAIRTLAAGGIYVQSGLQAEAGQRSQERREPALLSVALDEPDKAMLSLIARGFTSAQVAERVGMDPQSVARRYSDLTARLGLRGRVDLMRYAKQQGLL